MKMIPLDSRIRFILSFFFILIANSISAQNFSGNTAQQQAFEEKCAATYIEKKQRGTLGIYGTREYFEYWVEDKRTAIKRSPHSFRTQADGKRKIPVVIHVIHNGTPVGEGANIPFSQIQAQIDILNEDYRKLNPDSENTPDEFKGVAADANIEFVLAKQDPDGLASNGINRVAGPKANYSPDDAALIGQLALWPPEDYMNIWVVPLQSPFLGYSAFPISELPGLDFPDNTRETDGVTIDYRVFGEGGNAISTSAGRTATHEIGHFFGLRHIWGDGGCEVDDFVEDTPNQSQSNNTCLATPRITCGSRDMIENFMDYTPDQCMTLFTEGQVERVDVVLNFSPRRASLVNGKATQEPELLNNNLSVEAIVDPQGFACAAESVPKVAVKNLGKNVVTSTRVEISLNGKLLENKTFNLKLNPGASETLTFKAIVLPSSRENTFKVEIKSVNGKTDSDLANNSLQTHPKIQPAINLPYTFEAADFSDWSLKNPDNGKSWEQIKLPINGAQQNLIYLNGFNYDTQGELDYFISPQINLAESPNAQLTFQLAFAPYADEELQESLLIAVSTDCGNSFELLDAPYHKTGNALGTVGTTEDQFFPSSESQFRKELVNLSAYSGEGDIRIAFISINGYGNNIFVKNIEILPTQQYKYDFNITRVISPGPFVDGSQEREVMQITNTGNLPIQEFQVNRISNDGSEETFFVEDENLLPEKSLSYTMPNGLNEGVNRVEYEILYPNFDQNGGNNSQLVWHYIQDDSSIVVPWRQNFDAASSLEPWLSINPEENGPSWEIMPVLTSESENNQVLALDNAKKGNSHWLGSPLFDLSGTTQASLFFERAAGGFSGTDQTNLLVLISTDGGISYDELWRKENTQINSISGGGNANPNSAGDYVKEHIDLSSFTGEGFEKVRLAFKVEYLNGSSLPIYLDNIELFLSANPDPVIPGMGKVVVFPNPTTDLFNITFYLEEYEDVNIQIISPAGQIIHDVEYANTLNQTYTFSSGLFSKGVFIVKIAGDNMSEIKRLIIQ